MTAFYKTKAGNNQLGDTIVEVLLAIAVVGIVLTATFVSANRSLRGIQLSKDRSEALTLAKSAVTEIKEDIQKPIPALSAGSNGCLAGNLTITTSTPCPDIGSNGFFQAKISRGSSGGTPDESNKYTIMVTWVSATSGTPQQLEIIYRAEKK